MASAKRKRAASAGSFSRRSVLAFGTGSFAAGIAAGILGNEATSKLVDPLLQIAWAKGLDEFAPTVPSTPQALFERTDLIHRLFLSSGAAETEFIPPANWHRAPPDVRLTGGTITYGHEAAVLRTISTFICSDNPTAWLPTTSSWDAHERNSQVLLGSGAANQSTAEILGTPDHPKISDALVRLHYGVGKGSRRFKRLQYGKELLSHAHSICNSDGKVLCEPEVRFGRQDDDYLLVTRLPGRVKGTVITIFAGLHGPGTRGAELIFSALSLTDLRELDSQIGPTKGRVSYYQAVFRASTFKQSGDLASSDRRNMLSDIPSKLELVTKVCPPRRLEHRD